MDGQRSREALINFIDYLADKGLLEKSTAQSRKAAASKVLSILEGREAEDVTTLDIEDVMARFSRLRGKDYTPGSLTTYKARLHVTIDDFRSYLSNPLAFRPSTKGRARPRLSKKDDGAASNSGEQSPQPTRATASSIPGSDDILPIPIRPNLTIRIQGLPFDLTPAEAQKIAAVVTAMAEGTQPPSTRG